MTKNARNDTLKEVNINIKEILMTSKKERIEINECLIENKIINKWFML
ncbi:hypothetical protein F320042A7_28220 [Blautia producta]